ncbi:MAG: DUF4351 domain-containing protein [Chloracidobacterium sp.]|uniref:DUF4351 domain-containing protein n=1 Tax=Chloracidobacterium validum TaxID=2821543 RepID=A0ABX8BCM7_9BACT|nr:DUF4351 domain-containing protein [Chloracidobacterium validum]QUW04441.1 DUF4351 domain-containing protein [Chloracidobacterium validum]
MIQLEQLRESSVYQLILQQGRVEGLERGLEHERLLMTRLLRRRFGALAPEVTARIQTLGRESLERLADALFDLADALAVWLERAALDAEQ